MKSNNWYIGALESTLKEQQFEVDELKAEISYLENSEHKSVATVKMINELKRELTNAFDNLKSATTYVENQRQYA